MALKKSQLYSSLWQSCDELRGGMDASQYKDYVLTLLFVKYISDKYADKPSALIDVPTAGGFADMVKLKGDKEIGDKINKIISRLAEANDLKGIIDHVDFNDESKLGMGKEMQDRLSKLVAIFEYLDFRANLAEGDDLLGDAYEYLMRHFATESGKSKGQFYTPAEVSRVMAQIISIGIDISSDQTIYDPTCGSGSLLLKIADQAPRGITIYGQEIDVATWALARMNLILHGHPTADVWRANTLASPYFKNQDGQLKTFDFAVANPPFSVKAWSNGFDPANDEFGRFEYGIPPAKNGDYAFLLHMIASLKSNGKGAIIMPHGVLFRGYKESDIRRNIINRGFIKGIIGLPANLFYGTGIPACIIIIDKENANSRKGIFMIDASKGFVKDGNKNRLREQDIHKIVDVFNRQLEIPCYASMVSVAKIANSDNEYNLNIPRYIHTNESEDLHDLNAHLNGGVPNCDIYDLREYWNVFPSLRTTLFKDSSRAGYSEIRVKTQQIKGTIIEHPEFKAYTKRVVGIIESWCESHEQLLKSFEVNDLPKTIIHTLSDDLLVRFAKMPLINCYNVYQHLMDYWVETMQDDLYLIATDGWVEAAKPISIIEDKDKKIKETPDLTLNRKKYKLGLVPLALVMEHFFAQEQVDIEVLLTRKQTAVGELEEFAEEYTDEDGLLEYATNNQGKVTRGGINDRLKAIKDKPKNKAERDVLTRCLELIEIEAGISKAAQEAQAVLDVKVIARYSQLTEAEIKPLVIKYKWFSSLRSVIEGEVESLTLRLVGRVRELDKRYSRRLPYLEQEVATFSLKVEAHLKKMGLMWK